jgi:hypothetical protein
MGERKTFTTTIDSDIQKRFRLACVQNETRMNDVLEILMTQYALETENKKTE